MIPACSSATRVRATELDSVPSRVGGHWFRTNGPFLPRRRTASTVISPAAISRYVGLLTITLRSAAFMAATMSPSGAVGVSITSNSQPDRLQALTTAKSFAAAVSINSSEPSNRSAGHHLRTSTDLCPPRWCAALLPGRRLLDLLRRLSSPRPPFRETITQIPIRAPAHPKSSYPRAKPLATSRNPGVCLTTARPSKWSKAFCSLIESFGILGEAVSDPSAVLATEATPYEQGAVI
jgi:hypothetical protein